MKEKDESYENPEGQETIIDIPEDMTPIEREATQTGEPLPSGEAPASVAQERVGKFRVAKKIEYVNGVAMWRVSPDGSTDPKDSFLMVPADRGAVNKNTLMNAVGAAIGEPTTFRLVKPADKKDAAGIVEPANHWVLIEAPLTAVDRAKQGPQAFSEQSGNYFIREMTLDRISGDKVYRISPNDPNASEQELVVRVAGNNPDRSAINKALKGAPGSTLNMDLIQSAEDAGTNRWQVLDVNVGPARNRMVKLPDPKDKNRRVDAFEWTDNLDEKVDNWMAFDYMGKATRGFSASLGQETSPEINALAKQNFTEIMMASAAARGVVLAPEEINQKWEQLSPKKRSVDSILAGQEIVAGQSARVCYGVESPFERQVDLTEGTIDDLAHRANNYSYQKALHSSLTGQVAETTVNENGKVIGSGYEDTQKQMVKDRVLFAANPKLTSYDMSVRDAELSEMAVAKVMRNLMNVRGAKFVSSAIDDVRYSGPGEVQPTHVAEIRARLESEGFTAEQIERNPELNSKVQARLLELSLGYTKEKQNQIMTGSNGILQEQDENAIRPPFARNTPFLEEKTADTINKITSKTHEVASDLTTKAHAALEEMEAPIM